jgi:hypothetical protein
MPQPDGTGEPPCVLMRCHYTASPPSASFTPHYSGVCSDRSGDVKGGFFVPVQPLRAWLPVRQLNAIRPATSGLSTYSFCGALELLNTEPCNLGHHRASLRGAALVMHDRYFDDQ